MTVFGDTNRFGIEFEALSVEPSERWGTVRLWVASRLIGDESQIDLIGYIADYFRRFASKSRKVPPELENLGVEEAFRVIFDALYKGQSGMSGAEAENRYRRFVVAPNGMTVFDGERVALMDRGSVQVLVFRRDRVVSVETFDQGECERVMAQFVAWLMATYSAAEPPLEEP